MKNADRLAFPIEINGFGQYAPEVHGGLTKREVFAMNAPVAPPWFVNEFKRKNYSLLSYNPASGCNDRISFDAGMKLEREWRYAYADLMLEE